MTTMSYTEQQIAEFAAEVRRQAIYGHKLLDSIYWPPLEAIASRPWEMFPLLRERGVIVREEVLAGCYGHTVYHLS